MDWISTNHGWIGSNPLTDPSIKNTALGQACTSAYAKLDEYYKMIKKQNFAIVAIVCNSQFNFNVF